jgi:HEAT repeat protein
VSRMVTIINDLLSPDHSVNDTARSRAFGVLIPRLAQEGAADAAKEVDEISSSLASKNDQVRIQASALLAAVSTLRNDGTAVFSSAMPDIIRAFRDNAPRVRVNATSAVSNLKPIIPTVALNPLLEMLRDSDPRTIRAAVYGIARFAGSSAVAVGSLRAVLADHENSENRRAVMEAMTATHAHVPELVAQAGEALDDPNPDVVTDALLAIQGAGGEAVDTYRQKIIALAQRGGNSRVSETAARILESVGK